MKRLQFALPLGIHEVTSHPSLPFDQAPAFLAELRAMQEGVKAKAMEFVMLTAVRIADICGGGKEHSEPMMWSHVDMTGRLWTIPDTKMGRPHIVPLSEPALRLLGEMRRFKDPASDFVFPGANCRHRAQRRHAAPHAEGDGPWRRDDHARHARLLQDLGVGDHRSTRRT